MERIYNTKHNWVICVDLKMMSFLLGQKSDYTKFPYFVVLVGQSDERSALEKKGLAASNKNES